MGIISELNIKFMKIALEQAEIAFKHNEVPVGAVIVENLKIISLSYNQNKLLNNPLAHAEILAINSASEILNVSRLSGCSLYVSLEPCLMCMGAIINSRIENLFFGAYDPKAGACGSIFDITKLGKFTHPINTIGGILEDESKTLLKSFFFDKR